MNVYGLHRYTVILPHVDNDGTPVRYTADYHTALIEAGYNFTTYQTTGVWNGVAEPGTLFELYLGGSDLDNASRLGELARSIATDQEAIQVTYDESPTIIYEA
jgi:hypothetical protein